MTTAFGGKEGNEAVTFVIDFFWKISFDAKVAAPLNSLKDTVIPNGAYAQ
jgi:hypothetical protein